MRFSLALSFFIASTVALPHAHGQFCDTEVFAGTPTVQGQFGSTLALSPDEQLLAVGSPFGLGASGCNSGTVNLYARAGTGWTHVVELESPNVECDGQFGYDVSLLPGFLVVGAPFEDVNGVSDAGRAYVYSIGSGSATLAQTLTEINSFGGARYGHSVSLQSNGLAISSIRSSFFGSSAGAVYVYRNSGGQYLFEDRLAPNPAQAGAFFGTSVSLFGSNCVVGAVYEDTVGNQAGAAYVFRQQANTTWSLEQKFEPPTPGNSQFFGISVAIWGPFAVIGAEGAGPGSAGQVFVYRRATASWLLEATLESPSPVMNGTFGRAVAAGNGRLVASDFTSAAGGLTTVFERVGNTWIEETSYLVNDPVNSGAFGTECSLMGDTVAIGAPLRSGSVPFTGSAFLYDLDFADCNLNGVNDVCELEANGSLIDCDQNGQIDSCEISVDPALDCDANGILDACEITAFPGLDCDANGVLDSCEIASNGALDCDSNGQLDRCDILFGGAQDLNGNLVLDQCESVGVPQGCQILPNSTGQPGTLTAIGSGQAANSDLALIAGSLPSNVFGLPIVSRTAGSNVPANSVGFLCVGGTIGRDIANVFNSGPMGTPPAILVDTTQVPQGAGFVPVVAGETWYWQIWHRDTFANQGTSTFTDSIRIDFQ